MDDMNDQDTATGDEVEGSTDTSVTQLEAAPEGAADASAGTGASESEQPGEAGKDDDIQAVEGEDGKKYVPYDAFMARINALTKQKHAASDPSAFVETLKNNPEAKQKFLEALGIESKEAGDVDSEEGAEDKSGEPEVRYAEAEQFLGSLTQPEHKAFYTNMMQSMIVGMERNTASYVQSEIQKALKPLMRHIGSVAVDGFSQKAKDFPKYKAEVEKLMRNNSSMTIEQAYKLASYDDLVKRQAAGAPPAQNRQKLKKVPIAGRNNSTNGAATDEVDSLDDALKSATRELGGIKNIRF